MQEVVAQQLRSPIALAAISSFLEDASTDILLARFTGLATGAISVALSNAMVGSVHSEFQVTMQPQQQGQPQPRWQHCLQKLQAPGLLVKLTLCMQVILAKLRPGPVQLADIPANIAISSISSSPMSNLYHTIKSIYQPLLCSGSAGQGARSASLQQQQQLPADNKLQDLLLQLEAGLGSALRMGQEVRLGSLVCICLLTHSAVHSRVGLRGIAASFCQVALKQVHRSLGMCWLDRQSVASRFRWRRHYPGEWVTAVHCNLEQAQSYTPRHLPANPEQWPACGPAAARTCSSCCASACSAPQLWLYWHWVDAGSHVKILEGLLESRRTPQLRLCKTPVGAPDSHHACS